MFRCDAAAAGPSHLRVARLLRGAFSSAKPKGVLVCAQLVEGAGTPLGSFGWLIGNPIPGLPDGNRMVRRSNVLAMFGASDPCFHLLK